MSARRESRLATLPMVIAGAALVFSVAAPIAAAQAQPVWEQSFSEPYGVVVLRNAAGRTTVTSGPGRVIQVVAERADGAILSPNAVEVDKTAPGVLSLRVAEEAPTLLTVKVPAPTHVSVQGGAGTVLVQGRLLGLSVETETGDILVQLPLNADADISLQTRGEIVTGMDLLRAPAEAKAGLRLGRGGARVDLRSATGKIFLVPYPGGESRASPQRAEALEEGIPGEESGNGNEATEGAPTNGSRGSAATRPAASTGAAISVTSQMVLANVTVSAPPASPTGNLVADHFNILDNGEPQKISYFAPVNEPLDLLLLLDLSGSTESKFKLIKKAVERFIAAINPRDRVAIAAFTARYILVSDFTADRSVLLDRVKRMKNPKGGTKFYRAMWLSLEKMARIKGHRKAIVVMTDGVDNSLGQNALATPAVAELLARLGVKRPVDELGTTEDDVDFESLLQRISGDGVSIYPVYLNTEYEMVVRQGRGDSTEYQEARDQLKAIADVCGTTIFRAERIEDLDGAYEKVASELRNLYTIGFYPSQARQRGEWHGLTVNMNLKGFTARTRRGYYVD